MSHDLSFVAPERRDEVLRRIDVVERFMAAPGRAAAEAAAIELGLRPAQFYNLARAWKELGRPEALAGSGRPRQRPLKMTEEQAAFADIVIAANARCTPRVIVARIIDAATEQGLELPAREIVSRYVFRSRPSGLPHDQVTAADIVVDHAVLDLPVSFDASLPTRPLATFVIDAKREAVIGLALSDGQPAPEPTAEALLRALRSGLRHSGVSTEGPPRIAYPGDEVGDWRAIDAVLAGGGVAAERLHVGDRGHGRVVEALVGRKAGGIVLRSRLVTASPAKRAPTGWLATRTALAAADALALAEARLVHAGAHAAFAGLDETHRRILENGLAALAHPSD